MILPIVCYPNPVLREKGARIDEITDEHRSLARDMLETMYENRGLGLAAQQVGRALQMTVLDVRGSERPSQLFLGVREVPVDSIMPLVLINPAVVGPKGGEVGAEGCLSFPGLYGDVLRPSEITLEARDLEGAPVRFTCTGLLARAIQHEVDHLHGVLFIDRMEKGSLAEMEPDLKQFEKKSNRGRRTRK